MQGTLRETILELLQERHPKTLCPSEVARRAAISLGVEWRDLMVPIRMAALGLEQEGLLHFYQRGERLSGERLVGPVRLKRA